MHPRNRLQAICFACCVASCACASHLRVTAPHHDKQEAAVPDDLRHLYVCIAFHWSVIEQVYLRQVLSTIAAYPTKAKVCVISNEPQRLQAAIAGWGGDPGAVCGTSQQLASPHDLAFVHREYMEIATSNTEFTAFMYLEHDMEVSWPALLAWAEDAALLAPLGFQRSFYRVETAAGTGRLALTDQRAPINITAWDEKLVVPAPDPGRRPPLQQVRHFLRMDNHYTAMWVATRADLVKWMRSEQWMKRSNPWPVREMAACGLQFVDVPAGFVSAAVVPYDPDTRHLDAAAAIRHLSNKKCAEKGRRRRGLLHDAAKDPGWHPGYDCSVQDVDDYLFV